MLPCHPQQRAPIWTLLKHTLPWRRETLRNSWSRGGPTLLQEFNSLFSSLPLASAVEHWSLLFLFYYLVFSRTLRMTRPSPERNKMGCQAATLRLPGGLSVYFPVLMHALQSPALIFQPNATFSFGKNNNKILKHSFADTSTP